MSKPAVVVLGGCGFIGRTLVTYLKQNDLVSKVRVADKVLPDLAGLSDEQLAIFKSDFVDFKQCNLSRDVMVKKCFDGEKFDFVFNLAGETKYSQTDDVYKENVVEIARLCAAAAKASGVKRWVEVSSAQVYDAGKKPSSETDKIKPWTQLAVAKKAAEEAVTASGIDHIIVRPAIVYGPGDISGLTPRLITSAIYKKSGEKMEFLWDKDLCINTVHVDDVVRALWFVTSNGPNGAIYNLADSGNSTQGSIGSLLETLFGIKTTYFGTLKSKAATAVAMKTVAEVANEKHLSPWSELCKENGITNTPLTPYLDEELLYNNPLSIDGSKITTDLKFTYNTPAPTVDALRDTVNYFVKRGYFPKGSV